MFEMYIEAIVRGYHVYLGNASIRIGEILAWEMEFDNSHDKHTVAVKSQDENLVGHVPKEISGLFHKFLNDFGEHKQNVLEIGLMQGKKKELESYDMNQ